MIHSRPAVRRGIAVAIGLVMATMTAGAVVAHPASEGSHASGCIVTVEPGSVAVGGQFTVSGQGFSGASIYLVSGVGASPAAGATPDATTPEGTTPFSVTFTAEAADVGDWTVWGLLPETECGDSDNLTVTAAVPNTALPAPSLVATFGWLILGLGLALGLRRVGLQGLARR